MYSRTGKSAFSGLMNTSDIRRCIIFRFLVVCFYDETGHDLLSVFVVCCDRIYLGMSKFEETFERMYLFEY